LLAAIAFLSSSVIAISALPKLLISILTMNYELV
jgi:hypothetical protein